MKKQKSLAYDSAKKKKILLGTLIPLGCLVAATAIVVPVVLTQCKNDYFKLKTDRSIFTIDEINDGVSMQLTNTKDSWVIMQAFDNSISKCKTIQDYVNVRDTSHLFFQWINPDLISERKGGFLEKNPYTSLPFNIDKGEKMLYGWAWTEEQFSLIEKPENHLSENIVGDKVKIAFTVN